MIPIEEFEEAIIKFGVVAACEWFGYTHDSKFTKKAIEILGERHLMTTDIINLLLPFCDPDRPRLARPYTIQDYTYATNNIILVRVPRIASITKKDGHDPVELIKQNPKPQTNWIDLPNLPAPTVCPECGGTEYKEEPPTQIGPRKFRTAHIRKLASLPGIQIAPTTYDAAWFHFDGGDGLVAALYDMRPRHDC